MGSTVAVDAQHPAQVFRIPTLAAAEEWVGAAAALAVAEAGDRAWALVWDDAKTDKPVALVVRGSSQTWTIEVQV